MELKMMFYLSKVAIAVNISQPSVRIGGDLHALIDIYFLHGGSKSAKPFWDLKGEQDIVPALVSRHSTADCATVHLEARSRVERR